MVDVEKNEDAPEMVSKVPGYGLPIWPWIASRQDNYPAVH